MKYLKVFVTAIIIVLLIRTFAFTSCTIPSCGMENSLYQGDRVIVNKWSYGLRTPFLSFFSYSRWAERPVGKGDIILFNNPMPVSPPAGIDNREIYISRCIGLPGDTLMLDNELNLTRQTILSPDSKLLYAYPHEQEDTLLRAMEQLNITGNQLIGYNKNGFIRSFSHYEIYLLKQALGRAVSFLSLQTENKEEAHPFIIPGKGKTVQVYPWNIKLLRNTILLHEGKNAEVQGDTLYVNGKKVSSYLFTQDYYWMASNNSINLSDSRLFGLVPKSHLIGKASWIWFSKDIHTKLWEGYRWDRFFQPVK